MPFCPSLALVPRHPHEGASTRTRRRLPPGFVLITDGETKSAGGDQSHCQPGLPQRAAPSLPRARRRRANVRCEQNVYLSGISSGSLHTQHIAVSILPLEAKHTHALSTPRTHSQSFLCSLPSAIEAAGEFIIVVRRIKKHFHI